jgi:hypothetical protein
MSQGRQTEQPLIMRSTCRSSTLDGDCSVAVFVVTVFRILVDTEHLQDGQSIECRAMPALTL